MAQQLIFTSAVAGLNPGSSGYCTVAQSEAMRDAVVTRLEQWSVYTHQAGGQNPVVCAYRVLNLRGSVFHVLTRIVDSGLDYTGRTNFLAHHLVFQPHEIHGACSPAEVFLQWPGWVNQWQGAPRHLEDDGLSLHGILRSTKMPAETWKRWAGDAGAATLLVVEGGGSATARSADVVVPAGSETVLPHLYAESLHLIDPKGENAPAAWGVTFTTFLQSQEDAGDFRWRGLSPASRTRAAGGISIDFVSGAIPSAAEGPFTEYARTSLAKAAFLPGVQVTGTGSGGVGMQTPSPTLGKLPGIRTRPPISVSGNHGRVKPDVAAVKQSGIPRWLLISLACIVPLGIAVGWWTAQRVRNNAAVTQASPSNPTSAAADTPTPTPGNPPVSVDSPTALADLKASPAPTTVQDESLARRQAKMNILQDLTRKVTSEQALMQGPQSQTFNDLQEQSQKPNLEEANIERLTGQLGELDKDLEEVKRAQTLLNLLPDCPVYIASVMTSMENDFIIADDDLGRELTRLNEDQAPQNHYDLRFSPALFASGNAVASSIERNSGNGSLEARLETGRVVLEDKKILFKGCRYPLVITIQSTSSRQGASAKETKFVLVALQADNPSLEGSKRVILRQNDFLEVRGRMFSVRETMLSALKAKLARWKSPKGAAIRFGLDVSLKNQIFSPTLESLLAQARTRQDKEAEHYQRSVANASYSVDVDPIINWVQAVQTENHPPQVGNAPPAVVDQSKVDASRKRLAHVFDRWAKQQNISPLSNFDKNGRTYCDFLRDLLKGFNGGEAIARDKLPSPLHNPLEAIMSVPDALKDKLNDPKLSKIDREKIQSLAFDWAPAFGPDDKAFLETTDASPAKPLAPKRQALPDYSLLLAELQNDPASTFNVSIQATLASDTPGSEKSVKIIDFAP